MKTEVVSAIDKVHPVTGVKAPPLHPKPLSKQEDIHASINHLEDVQNFLPEGVTLQNGELIVDLEKNINPKVLKNFVEKHVFGQNLYLVGISNGWLAGLLFEPSLIAGKRKELLTAGNPLRLSIGNLLPFSLERQALYQKGRANVRPQNVEYRFQFTFQNENDSEPIPLDIDEFLAFMAMEKGVWYGFDIPLIRKTITEQKSELITIAKQREVIPAKDASIAEVDDAAKKVLYRNDAPKEISGGKVDFRQFQNRIPQAVKGQKLLRKTPPKEGISGRDVFGEELPSEAPKDFELFSIIRGTGLAIEINPTGEYVIAQKSGFIEWKNGTIELTDHIIHKEVVSAQETGRILDVHGDFVGTRGVENKGSIRTQKTARIDGNVRGEVIAEEDVYITGDVISGTVESKTGSVTIKGEKVSASIIRAKKGKIEGRSADASTLLGKEIVLEAAKNCRVSGSEVSVKGVEACTIIVGGKVCVDTIGHSKHGETIILMVDFSDSKEKREETEKRIRGIDKEYAFLDKKFQQIKALPDVQEYVSILRQLREVEAKKIVLSEPERKRMATRGQALSTLIRRDATELSSISKKLQLLLKEKENLNTSVAELRRAEEKEISALFCDLKKITGRVIVRRVNGPKGKKMEDLSPENFAAFVTHGRVYGELLFDGSSGSFYWESIPAERGEEEVREEIMESFPSTFPPSTA